MIRAKYRALEQLGAPKVSIHNDLNPRNIFSSDRGIYFIDWSEATWEDPFYDLAFLSIVLDYNSTEEKLLLKSYLKHQLTPLEIKRYALVKQLNFARLCLGAYNIAAQLVKAGETIDYTHPVTSWSCNAPLFAGGSDQLPAQYFFEVARAALDAARAIDEMN